MYIALEGVVGAGKTTQALKLVDYLKAKYPRSQVIFTYEPGGTEIADATRKLVQATKFNEEMDPVTEAYLYAAARAQSLRKVVMPNLKKGAIVVADRCVVSSIAFQGFGRGLGIKQVSKINEVALTGLLPDKIVFLDMPGELGLARAHDHAGDKWESYGPKLATTIRTGYLKIAKVRQFKKRWVHVDASGTQEEVFALIVKGLNI